MTDKEKQLLLADLCGRLPYGVKFTLPGNNIYTMKGIDLIVTDEGEWEYAVAAKGIVPIEIKYIKPYLRLMSSMTKEEENFVYNGHIEFWIREDYCNQRHLDYRGLIEKGLAIAVTEENNPYK